jgi:UDP-N-acetylbacillosamine N-acetyltransferase
MTTAATPTSRTFDGPDAVVFGASRQGKVVLEVLRAQGRYHVIGLLDDDSAKHGAIINGAPVLGGLSWALGNTGRRLAAIVAIGRNDARVKAGEMLRVQGIELLNAIHPSAVVTSGVTIGTGNLVCAGAVIITGTLLEDSVVVNTAASVDHDCVLETGAYVGPGVHTAGCVRIGRGAFIGVGAILGPGVNIGAGSIIGAGSVVLSDIPSNVVAFGSPATVVRELEGTVDWRRILAGKKGGHP